MSIGRGDRFKLICFLGKIHRFKDFKVAFWNQLSKGQGPNEKSLNRSFQRWCEGGALTARNKKIFLAAVKAGWPSGVEEAPNLMMLEETVPAFLEKCKLSYDDVEALLSPEGRAEWKAARHNLHFMKALDDQSKLAKAKAILPDLVGTYRLYRSPYS